MFQASPSLSEEGMDEELQGGTFPCCLLYFKGYTSRCRPLPFTPLTPPSQTEEEMEEEYEEDSDGGSVVTTQVLDRW